MAQPPVCSKALSWRSGEKVGQVQGLRVYRECLDDHGKVVRSCPIDFIVGPDGAFSQEIWVKSVGEALCRDDVVTERKYEERVQLRFHARGCTDLIVPYEWPSEPGPLVMQCSGKNNRERSGT